MNCNRLRNILAFVAAACALPGQAGAACAPVAVVPAVISTPGQYCLTQDLTFAGQGFAITISASNVTLDLQGYEMRGPHFGGVVASPLTAAVYAADQSNLIIRNGRISGFGDGVRIDLRTRGSSGNLIENLHIDGNSSTGMLLQATQTVVRNNRITNLNAFLQGSSNQGARGIHVQRGGFTQISNNTITAFNGSAITAGIVLEIAGNGVIEGNTIAGAPNPFSATNITGIQLTFSQGVTIAANRILRVYKGIEYGNQATGKYSGNITDDLVQIPYTGGTAVGSNF